MGLPVLVCRGRRRVVRRLGCLRERRLAAPAHAAYHSHDVADTEVIFVVEEAPEGGYTARALGYAIHTEADSMVELKVMVQDAVRCHFDEAERPAVVRLHVVRDELLPV
jgi:hypothetical protein